MIGQYWFFVNILSRALNRKTFFHQHTQWLNDLIQVVFDLEHAPALPVLAL